MPSYYDIPGPEVSKVFAYQAGTTHKVFEIPTAWKGRKVDITARAPATNSVGQPATVWVLFGASASIEVDRTAFVTGTPPEWESNAKSGRPVRDGETIDRFVKSTWTHFAVESDLANVEIYITPSDFPDAEA